MAAKRDAGRCIGRIPTLTPAQNSRRTRLERDPAKWLRHYMPDLFDREFGDAHHQIIREFQRVMKHGGFQSIAAPRGIGKSTLVVGLIIYAIVTGKLRHIVEISKSLQMAHEQVMDTLIAQFEDNDRLAADYPEVCYPIRSLDGAPARANMQTYEEADGTRVRTAFQWSGDLITFPKVRGSRAAGTVFRVKGADAAIKGLVHRGRRPDFVLIDDPETGESARSAAQVEKITSYIKQGVAGLGRIDRSIGIMMLTTIEVADSVSDIFTDPDREPVWRGIRIPMLTTWPTNRELWDEYVRLYQAGQHPLDPTPADAATQHYRKHRADMDAGASTCDDRAFNSMTQLSMVQACFDIVATRGLTAFLTEYQAAPPEESKPRDSGITAAIVCGRLHGLGRRIMPRETAKLTMFVDVGQYRLHYAATAWRPGRIGYIIDYGIRHVARAGGMTVEESILQTLREFRDELLADPYVTEDGEPRDVDLPLVDAGHWNTVIYRFVAESPRWRAAMGDSRFQMPKRTRERRPSATGEPWYDSWQPARLFVVNHWSDHWKQQAHEAFITEPMVEGVRQNGTLTLFGDRPRDHMDSETGNFSQQIVAEVWREHFVEGKGLREGFHKIHANNHYLDCVAGNILAASVAGVTAFAQTKPTATAAPRTRRPTLTAPDGRPYLVTQRN